jgi:hypothetical protein
VSEVPAQLIVIAFKDENATDEVLMDIKGPKELD